MMRRQPPAAPATVAPGVVRAVQLRLPLTPPCEWHTQPEAKARGLPPCARDAQVRVSDPVRDRYTLCCASHALTLVAMWRETVPNRRRNAARITLAWLPDVSHRVALPRVIGSRHRRTVPLVAT
jgi:hypothetical protein